jgi:short-subunit dehydrogenase
MPVKYIVGATGRRTERLDNLKQQAGDRLFIQYMDVTKVEQAIQQLDQLTQKMGGLDIIVLNAGVSNYQGASGRKTDLHVINVNIRGFANLVAHSFAKFEEQGHGHLVGVSSIASFYGWGLSAPYNASKAFVNTYLQGYRQKANHSEADITVTTILPGFVKSEMTQDKKGMFWVAPTQKAAKQIADAIENRKNKAYITKRWRLVAWLVKFIPDWVWNKM